HIAILTASITTRSGELSNRKKSGLPIDSGHTGRLAAERRKLQECIRKREECKKGECPDRVPVPVPVPTPNELMRRRLDQPTMDELRLQVESARGMETVWKTVLVGDFAIGTVLLAPEGGTIWILRWVGGTLRWVPVH